MISKAVESNEPLRKVASVTSGSRGTPGGQHLRDFRYTHYRRLLEVPEPMAGQDVPVQTTEAAG